MEVDLRHGDLLSMELSSGGVEGGVPLTHRVVWHVELVLVINIVMSKP